MNKYLLLALLLSLPLSTWPFHTGWFEDAMHIMHESIREMETHMERMRDLCTQSKSARKAETQEAHLETHMAQTDNGMAITIQHVHSGDIDAQLSDNLVTVKHPQCTMHIKQVKPNSVYLQLRTEQKHNKEGAQENAYSYYAASHAELLPLEHSVDLEKTTVHYDENRQELTINLVYAQKTKLIVTYNAAAEPPRS